MDRATLEGLIQDIFERGRKKGLAEAGVIVNDAASDGGEETGIVKKCAVIEYPKSEIGIYQAA